MDQADLERIWHKTLDGRDVDTIDPNMTLRPSPTSYATDPHAETLTDKPSSGKMTFLSKNKSVDSQEAGFATTLMSGAGYGAASSLELPSSWGNWRSRGTSDSLRILSEIGRGGMGVVYRAQQESLHREIAVKQIMPEKARPELVERFISESLITAMLDHPNIVPVHDLVETAQGEICLTMKLVGGVSWSELLHPRSADELERAARYELKDHLGILRNVCNAVAFAHSRGIVHLDLKPSNVMVGEFGEVLVMDWGIAVDYSEQEAADGLAPHRTDITVPSGTPRYLAPEMAEGRGDLIGPWSDVFLLGGILHELLTGRPPNHGEGMYEILKAACRAEPPDFPEDVPAGLAAICRKALSRQPGDRYQDPSAFSAAIGEYLEHRESQLIAERAEQQLGESRTLGDSDHIERYAGFAEAVAGFKQALHLWDGNIAARDGRNRAAIAYAEAALAAGDLALAASQADSIDDDRPERAQLISRVQAAQAQADKVMRQQRILRRSLVAAVLLIIAGLAIGTMLIDAQRQRAEEARSAEADARREVESQRQAAVEARDRAEQSENAARHEAWRMRLANAKALYDLGIERLAAGAVDEASATFLAAYETAPVDRVPEGFEPGEGAPDHASFAWRALHLRHLEQAPDRRLVFPQMRVVRDIAIGLNRVLYVAGDSCLAAIDLDRDAALWCLPLSCRHMQLDDQRQQLVVTTSDDQPPMLIDLVSGEQQRLPYEREGDFTFLFHHPRDARCSAWDQRHKALVTWELDPVEQTANRLFTKKPYPIAMHYKDKGLEWYDWPKPPSYPDMWPSYCVDLEFHGKEARPIFRSPDGRCRVVVRTRPGSIVAELQDNPWGLEVGTMRAFPGPDGMYPSNLLRFGQLADNGRLALYVKDRLHLLDLRMGKVIDGRPMPFMNYLRTTSMDPSGSTMAYVLRPLINQPGVFIVRTRSSGLGKAQAIWNLVSEGDRLRFDHEPVTSLDDAFKAGDSRRLTSVTMSTQGRHVCAVSKEKGGDRRLHVWSDGKESADWEIPIPAAIEPELFVHSAGDGRYLAFEYDHDLGGDGHGQAVSRRWIDNLDNADVESVPAGHPWTYPGGERPAYRPPALWFVDLENGQQHSVDFALPADAPARQGTYVQRFCARAFPGHDLMLLYDGSGVVALSANGRRGLRLAPPEGVDLRAASVSWSPAGDALIFRSFDSQDQALRMTCNRESVLTALARLADADGERLDGMQLPIAQGCLVIENTIAFPTCPYWFLAAPGGEFALLMNRDQSLSWVSGRSGEVIWEKHAVRGRDAAIDPSGTVTAVWNDTDDRVHFIDNATGVEFAEVELAIPAEDDAGYPSLVWSAEGDRLMIGYYPSCHVIDLFAPSVRDPSPESGAPILRMFRDRAACDVGREGGNWGQVERQARLIDLEQVGPPRHDSL